MLLSDTLATELLCTRERERSLQPGALAPPAATARPDADDALGAIRARCAQAMALCGAQSAGVSIFNNAHHDELAWIATCGVLSPFEGLHFVRRDSMCGICFEYREAQLFLRPQRYFNWMQQACIVVEEALVVPLFGPYGALYGTLWAMTHDSGGVHFDRRDAQALAELGKGMYARIWAHDAVRALAGENP